VWKPETETVPEESRELGEGVPYHLTAFDLSKTRAFAATASSNGIHIRMNPSNGNGTQNYEAFRKELADALLTRCVDPQTGKRLISKVWLREEVFAGPSMNEAPDLALTLHDNGFISVFRSDVVLKKRPKTAGTHHPDGIFIMNGPGVRPGQSLGHVKLIDIVPTMLYMLGVPLGSDLEGRVLEECFKPEYVASHELRVHSADDAPMFEREESEPIGEEDDPQILSRLKALGYIE
jgi:predicted AlkP superfamily phosphohydrolase/phosphomutase